MNSLEEVYQKWNIYKIESLDFNDSYYDLEECDNKEVVDTFLEMKERMETIYSFLSTIEDIFDEYKNNIINKDDFMEYLETFKNKEPVAYKIISSALENSTNIDQLLSNVMQGDITTLISIYLIIFLYLKNRRGSMINFEYLRESVSIEDFLQRLWKQIVPMGVETINPDDYSLIDEEWDEAFKLYHELFPDDTAEVNAQVLLHFPKRVGTVNIKVVNQDGGL